ncbi:MAG: YhjD/YihY/BrkB family envelope integrity protein [Saprospiraceae bacterium]
MIEQIKTYLNTDVWNVRTKELNRWKALGVNIIRIALLSIRDFNKDQCVIRASALTYYTLLTIVPVLAMAFGIAQGFGFEKNLEEQILASFAGQEEIIAQIFTFVSAMLERTRGGLMAGIGVVLLLYYVFRIMWNIERTMNVIWKVPKTRPAIRKLTDYTTLMIVGPLMVILSGSLNVYLKTTVEQITNDYAVFDSFSPLLSTPVRLIPYVMIWLVLTLVYVVMPNKKVKFLPALIAGILAGTAYQLTQWGYITFQVGVSNMNAIYGSFAALPLFFIWVQLSWTIILFGAEVAHSIQTMNTHEQYKDAQKLSPHYKQLLTIYVLHTIIQQFKNEVEPLTADEIAEKLDLPIQTVSQSIDKLTNAKIIAPTKQEKDEPLKYLPARDTEKLTISHILELLDKNGVNTLNMDKSSVLGQLEETLVGLADVGKSSNHNVLLKHLK